MKKYIILITSIILISNGSTAQKVLSTAGKHLYGSKASLNSTIGEPIIKTLTGANSALSQGFHQPGVPCELNAIFSGTDVSCFSASDGTAAVTISSGAPPYTFAWSPLVSADSTADSLSAGVYMVIVTDSNGCAATDSITINQPDSLSVSFTTTQALCGGVCDGQATVIVTGGTPTYATLWNDPVGPITPTITNLCAGTYSVTVSDSNGCTTSGSVIITDSLTLTLITSALNASCSSVCDGIATVTPTTGASPFNYLWDDPAGQTNNIANNLCVGNYSVVVTDAAGCTDTASATVNALTELLLSVTTTNATCGIADGSATVSVTGGTSPFAYTWSNGDSLATADTLSAGVYIATVIDANGCSNFIAAAVSDSGGPDLLDNVINVSCYGGSDGAITTFISGGTQPYTFLWSNGDTTQNISGLVAGPYELTVNDAAGCISNASILVSQPDPLNMSISANDANCSLSDGSATVSVSGGTFPYSYSWSSGGIDSNETGLTAGNYFLSITDSKNCQDSVTVSISNIGGPVITVDSTADISCDDTTGGYIYITVTGGATPYQYNWSDGSVTEDLINVQGGPYNLTITDSIGCIATTNITIAGSNPVSVPICVVTVDSATGKNLIVWEKPQTPRIKAYNIYREGSIPDAYFLAGTVPANALSTFIDSVSNPIQRAYRYKISITDSCDNESELSDVHKTMHLNINEGINNLINLIWDDYQGFSYFTYYVYRYTTSAGWEVLDSLPITLTSFTDPSPPPQNLWYQIEIKYPDPAGCQPTKTFVQAGNPSTAKVLVYNSARSNVSNRLLPSGISQLQATNFEFRVYPNPYTGKTEITYLINENADHGWIKNRANGVNVKLEVFNLLGDKIQVLVNEMQNSGKYKYSFSAAELGYSTGIYILKLSINDSFYIKKLIEY
ncbi:MAG: T9SS type A sorting domain-containing protein [Cytophagales bacterium]|nr:T9SS type A sorting domain-containing protein [Cytophagales bacterium]